MRIHNLYADENGESHFRDIDIEWADVSGSRKYSERLAATGIIFRETGADYDLDWHTAPRRQYIINLDAGVVITASDGIRRNLDLRNFEGLFNSSPQSIFQFRNESERRVLSLSKLTCSGSI